MDEKQVEETELERKRRQLAELQAQIDEMERATEISSVPSDKVQGDKVEGDKVEGDKIEGDKIEIARADQVHIHPGESSEEDDLPLQNYLETVARRSARLPLSPLDPAGQESAHISLAQVFVSLDAGAVIRPTDYPEVIARYSAALAHIHHNERLIFLGDPGSGKSTLLRFLALCLSGAALGPDGDWLAHLRWTEQLAPVSEERTRREIGRLGAESPDDLQTLFTSQNIEEKPQLVERGWTSDAPLPLPVTLREFAQETFDARSPTAIWQHVARQLEKEDMADAIEPLRRQALEGKIIFLLDGVDEVPEDKRAAVWGAIDALQDGPYGSNRWLATCRVLSFSEDEAPAGTPFKTIRPLKQTQIEAFIRSWYGALAEGEMGQEQAGSMILNLISAAKRERLRPLAQNPMLLTIMALVQTYHGTLPDERAKLYQACVETLLLRWQRHKEADAGAPLPDVLAQLDTTIEQLERLLWEIAWQVHKGQTGHEADGQQKAADIPEDEVMAIANRHLGSYAKAEAFLEYTERRAHLLLGRGGIGERVYAFPHRTFQEYLAACYLAAGRRYPQEAARLAKDPALWREGLNLAAGNLVFNQNNREKALDGAACVLPQKTPAAGDEAGWNRVWMAGEMMVVVGRQEAEADEVGRLLLPRLRRQLAALLEDGRLAPRQRAEAGDVLGLLGDPRPGVCDREPNMIPLPAGSFLMGDQNDEMALDAFAIARYPITNAQYRFFVEDGGYTDKWRDYWTEDGWQRRTSEGWSEPRYWQDAVRSIDNKPVVGVSWYEAVAYSNWLSRVTGRSFRLPTEAEWERAARHTDGREWPWGDDWQDGIVNSDEAGVGRAMAVGSFRGGAAINGAQDLSGNVWEWCQSRYWDEDGNKYPLPYRPDDGREALSGGDDFRRVLRGGAFSRYQWNVRAAYRNLVYPNYWINNVGFRVVEHLS